MLIQAFEMDARKDGIQQGKSLGLAEGSRQAKLETGFAIEAIVRATGLTQEEVESV